MENQDRSESEAFLIGNRTNFEHIHLLIHLASGEFGPKVSMMSLLEIKSLLRSQYREFL